MFIPQKIIFVCLKGVITAFHILPCYFTKGCSITRNSFNAQNKDFCHETMSTGLQANYSLHWVSSHVCLIVFQFYKFSFEYFKFIKYCMLECFLQLKVTPQTQIKSFRVELCLVQFRQYIFFGKDIILLTDLVQPRLFYKHLRH